jgi:Flp pilus assembly protein TadG
MAVERHHNRERLTTGDRGAAAVELALVLPILALLLFGLIEFGQAYSAKISLTGAVREGARSLALGLGDATVATKDAAPTLDPDDITVTTSDDPCIPGEQAEVTASYPYTYDIPFFGDGTMTLTATGVMRCGL